MNISKFFQAAPNVLIFRHAPTWFAMRYLRFLGFIYYLFNRRERYLIERNIKSVFNERNTARNVINKTFAGIFNHYSEKLIMAHRRYPSVMRELWHAMKYSGLEHLDRALEKGGVILVTAHLGGVEFMPLALALNSYRVTMIVRFQSGRLKESLMERARVVDVELIDGDSEHVMQQAFDALDRGRILLTECDEVDEWKTRPNTTVEAFGRNIFLDRSLAVLCRRTGATPLGSFMIREGNGYRLTIIPFDAANGQGTGELSLAIIKTFESVVMSCPDQWYQWKKFHKMSPEIA